METDLDTRSEPKCKVVHKHHNLARFTDWVTGAAIYFISTATTFWMGVLGF